MRGTWPTPEIRMANARGTCSGCASRGHCAHPALNAGEMARFERMVMPRLRVPAGGYLSRAGAALEVLCIVRSGALKSCVTDRSGRGQVTGFHYPGEWLGFESIASGRHLCDVIALADSEVCRLPAVGVQRLSREIPALGGHVQRLMSRQIERAYRAMLMLGSMRVEERVATLLLEISGQCLAREQPASRFTLPMTRNEIASYLGVERETVSRVFVRLQREAIIESRGREIHIVDVQKLQAVAQGAGPLHRDTHSDRKVAVPASPLPAWWRAGPATAGATHRRATG